MICPACNTLNPDTNRCCTRCGGLIQNTSPGSANSLPDAAPIENGAAAPFSIPSVPVQQAPVALTAWAAHPPAPLVAPGGPPVFYKNPSVATVLSFLWTGLGQCYNGQIGKGLGLIVVRLVLLPLCAIPVVGWILFIPASIALWAWGMYDAHKSAESVNRRMSLQPSGRA